MVAARRPARSAAEPNRPVFPFLSSSSSVAIGGAGAAGTPGPGVGRRAMVPAPTRGRYHGVDRRKALRHVAVDRRGPPGGAPWPPAVGKALRPPDFMSASISSLVTDLSGRCVLGTGGKDRFAEACCPAAAGSLGRRPWAMVGPILGLSRAVPDRRPILRLAGAVQPTKAQRFQPSVSWDEFPRTTCSRRV